MPCQNVFTSLAACAALVAVSHGQAPASWGAASGLLPTEAVPTWAHNPMPPGIAGCPASDATLGAGALHIDSGSCRQQIHTYTLLSGSGVAPAGPGTFGAEAELRLVSSLAADPDCGAAQLVVVAPPVCPWVLHIDVGEVFLESLSPALRTAPVAVDTITQSRTYRLEVDAVSRVASAYVDGQLVLTAPFAAGQCVAPGQNMGGVLFGDAFPADGGVVDWVRVSTDLGPTEQYYCDTLGTPNSTGLYAVLTSNHEASLAANALVLYAGHLPAASFGYFLCSRAAGAPVAPPASQGYLCLGGAIGRFVGPGQILQPGPNGYAALQVDLTALPTPTGPVSAMPGERWHFQFWYRDANPNPTSNLTPAMWIFVE